MKFKRRAGAISQHLKHTTADQDTPAVAEKPQNHFRKDRENNPEATERSLREARPTYVAKKKSPISSKDASYFL